MRACTVSGDEFLILRLSAHIRNERLWNRFSLEPSVCTVSEQLNAIQQFGADSGLYTLKWQSDGEGIAVLTMPESRMTDWRRLWALSSADALPKHESLNDRWEQLGRLISETPELQGMMSAFESATPEVWQAARIEQTLPVVSFLALDGPGPDDAALLPFEQARLVSSAVRFLYAQEHEPDFNCKTIDWMCYEETVQAAIGWQHYRVLGDQCRRILLEPLYEHKGENA